MSWVFWVLIQWPPLCWTVRDKAPIQCSSLIPLSCTQESVGVKLLWMCGWSLTYAAIVSAGSNVLSNMTVEPSPVSQNIVEALGFR